MRKARKFTRNLYASHVIRIITDYYKRKGKTVAVDLEWNDLKEAHFYRVEEI